MQILKNIVKIMLQTRYSKSLRQKIWQLTCDDVRDKLFRSGLFEAGRFLEAHRDGESGF